MFQTFSNSDESFLDGNRNNGKVITMGIVITISIKENVFAVVYERGREREREREVWNTNFMR